MVQPGDETEMGCSTSLFGESYEDKEIHRQYVVETVCRDLEREGYSVQPILIPACAVGAPHRRDRVWFIAKRADTGIETLQYGGKNGIHAVEVAPHADSERLEGRHAERQERRKETDKRTKTFCSLSDWSDFPTQPPICGRDDGFPFDVDRLTISFPQWRQESIKAYGNAIVPQVAYEIFKAIKET